MRLEGSMDDRDVLRYLTLVGRRLDIITSGISWKPEYGGGTGGD